jgi:uncharacterized protein
MPKAVLDSNIIVSALIVPHGKPAQIILLAKEGKFQCTLSEEIIQEVRNVLQRKHIQKKYHPSENAIEDFIKIIRANSTFHTIQQVENIIPNDPPDNIVLACAVESRADYLVSGNLHFINLKDYRNVKMVTPAQFLEVLAAITNQGEQEHP